MADCRVYWGTHACSLDRGHEGTHKCTCCECPEGAHDGVTAPNIEGIPFTSCVGQAPYYGPEYETILYGEDA